MVCLLVFTNTGICSTVNFKNKLHIKHCCCLLVYLCQLWAIELLRSWGLFLLLELNRFTLQTFLAFLQHRVQSTEKLPLSEDQSLLFV